MGLIHFFKDTTFADLFMSGADDGKASLRFIIQAYSCLLLDNYVCKYLDTEQVISHLMTDKAVWIKEFDHSISIWNTYLSTFNDLVAQYGLSTSISDRKAKLPHE